SFVIDALEHSEEAEIAPVKLVVTWVDHSRDAPHDLAVAPCEKQLSNSELKPRILFRVEKIPALHLQGRHPIRVAPVKVVGEPDEGFAVSRRLRGRHCYIGLGGRPSHRRP